MRLISYSQGNSPHQRHSSLADDRLQRTTPPEKQNFLTLCEHIAVYLAIPLTSQFHYRIFHKPSICLVGGSPRAAPLILPLSLPLHYGRTLSLLGATFFCFFTPLVGGY